MAASPSNGYSSYQPSGYCPRCDYPTDVGTCPECGHRIATSKLRRAPRGWLRRHPKLVISIVALGLAGGWLVAARPELNRWLPTPWLLVRQASDGPHKVAATEELAARYAAAKLSPEHTTRFLQQWLDLKWPDSREWFMHNAVRPQPPTLRTKVPTFFLEERVLAVRVDGQAVTVVEGRDGFLAPGGGGEREWAVWLLRPPVRLSPTVPVSGLQFAGTTLVLPRLDVGIHKVEIDTVAKVTDPGTGKLIAQWANAHRLQTGVGPRPRRANWEPGMEDLMFPYGRIPGREDSTGR